MQNYSYVLLINVSDCARQTKRIKLRSLGEATVQREIAWLVKDRCFLALKNNAHSNSVRG